MHRGGAEVLERARGRARAGLRWRPGGRELRGCDSGSAAFQEAGGEYRGRRDDDIHARGEGARPAGDVASPALCDAVVLS